MIVRGKAPLRISFAGGGTDIPPYSEERGGVVLSTAIDKYAYVTLTSRTDQHVQITSLDYGQEVRSHLHQLLFDGNLDLIKAALLNMTPLPQGADLLLHSGAPPGSGLGASSALAVATIGVVNHWLARHLPPDAIARLAYKAERVDLGIRGGMQDQYAAVFGGFNLMEFQGGSVVVTPLRLRPATVNELHYHLLLCYTHMTHRSAPMAEEQQQAYARAEAPVLHALDELKAITIAMKTALLQGRFDEFGDLLHAGWENKKRVARSITSPEIDALYGIARQQGALGGKLLGAGGGGYLLVYCPEGRKPAIAGELARAGGQIVDFAFDGNGLQTWTAAL